MKRILVILALVAGCGAGDPQVGNETAVSQNSAASGNPAMQAVRTAALTGLFESGGDRPDQLCIVDAAPGNSRFGLVVHGEGLLSCSGSGQAVRAGTALRLRMEGDEACEIEASVEGATIALPQQIPAGCAYYCAPGASLAGARFTRSGGSAADALKATDLAGDPLCG